LGAGLHMDVGTFTRSIRIGRPIDEVWSVLAAIGSIADWNPGVVASRTTTGQLQVRRPSGTTTVG